MKIAVVSDTHGTIHPDIYRHLDGVDLMLHAGDIGREDVISELKLFAPVVAVYGNTDTFPLVERYREKELIDVLGKKIYLTHRFIEGGRKIPHVVSDIDRLRPSMVVFGHTHRQHAESIDGILYFNPGSCGFRRPGTRTALGILTINNELINHEFIFLD